MAPNFCLFNHLVNFTQHFLPSIPSVSIIYLWKLSQLTKPFIPDFFSFVRNCVPQISDINIAVGVSMTYFALTIFNVLLLLFFYEIVAYGMA